MMDIYTGWNGRPKERFERRPDSRRCLPGIGASVDLRPSLCCLERLFHCFLVLSRNMLGEGRQGDCGEEADSGICRAGIHAKADYTPIHMYPKYVFILHLVLMHWWWVRRQ